jgi:Sulfotransferase family
VQDRLKDFIARHVFHPLEGMTLGDWWSLLRRHRFAIDPQHWPRALVQTAVSLSNSVGARFERRRFGRRIDATQLQPPLFILGHYRSGTTHLHNLLALDPQFAAPTFFQALNPHTFLSRVRKSCGREKARMSYQTSPPARSHSTRNRSSPTPAWPGSVPLAKPNLVTGPSSSTT